MHGQQSAYPVVGLSDIKAFQRLISGRLALEAFHRILRRKQSSFGGVLVWLDAMLVELRMTNRSEVRRLMSVVKNAKRHSQE